MNKQNKEVRLLKCPECGNLIDCSDYLYSYNEGNATVYVYECEICKCVFEELIDDDTDTSYGIRIVKSPEVRINDGEDKENSDKSE